MNSSETLLEKFKLKFETEYVCLKCGLKFEEPREACPKCRGPVCPRIFRKR